MLYVFPTAKEDVLKIATPLPFKVPVPSVVEPFLKVMVPVGVPEEPVTVAVKVTDWPKTLGFEEAARLVEVGVAFLILKVWPLKAMLFNSTLAVLEL